MSILVVFLGGAVTVCLTTWVGSQFDLRSCRLN